MKQGFIVILMMAFVPGIFAQTKFDKGYYIDPEGRRVECLINIQQTQKTPAEFLWKLTEPDAPQTATTSTVSEFGITGGKKFISARVNIDISSDDEKNPSDKADPEWSEQRVFLEVLVEGEATLYEYRQLDLERFFYKVKDGPVQQLVRKIFRKPDDALSIIRKNELFRQQLLADVKTAETSVSDIAGINYDKKDLVACFTKYNLRNGKSCIVYTRKKEMPGFHLKVTPGFRYAMFGMEDFDFPNQAGFRVGVEAELVFPYTNKQVSLVLEPSYHYYHATGKYITTRIDIDIKGLEFPVGFRYYFFHKKPVMAYINAFFVPGIPGYFSAKATANEKKKLDTKPGRCVATGAGLLWKRFSAEARFYTNRNIIGDNYKTKYSAFLVILGYRIF